jgi:hypothetical protein
MKDLLFFRCLARNISAKSIKGITKKTSGTVTGFLFLGGKLGVRKAPRSRKRKTATDKANSRLQVL